jgi:hypothetical protein
MVKTATTEFSERIFSQIRGFHEYGSERRRQLPSQVRGAGLRHELRFIPPSSTPSRWVLHPVPVGARLQRHGIEVRGLT